MAHGNSQLQPGVFYLVVDSNAGLHTRAQRLFADHVKPILHGQINISFSELRRNHQHDKIRLVFFERFPNVGVSAFLRNSRELGVLKRLRVHVDRRYGNGYIRDRRNNPPAPVSSKAAGANLNKAFRHYTFSCSFCGIFSNISTLPSTGQYGLRGGLSQRIAFFKTCA